MFDIFNTVFKYKEKSSPDKLGVYPERVHVKAMPERRYLWTSRVLVIMSVLSICLNMMLTCTIYLLIPQKSSAPRLLYINEQFNQIQLMEPIEIDVPSFNLVTEEQIRNYLMYRYIITSRYDELVARWSVGSALYWMSSPTVFKKFEETEYKQGIMLQKMKGLQRDIEIDWVTQIARGVWYTQFRTIDYYPNTGKPDTTIWRATMRVVYASINFSDKNFAMLNPFGFIISNYSLAYHGKPDASDHYLNEALKTSKERNM